MTLKQIAKLGKIEPNNENLEILSYYQTACQKWLESKEFKNSNWAKKPYPPLLNPDEVVYEKIPDKHAWMLNLPLPKNYDFVLFGSHAAGMHAALPGFFTLCGVCVRAIIPKQMDIVQEGQKGSFGCYCLLHKKLLAMKKVKELGYTKKAYLQITNLILDSDAKKFYSLIDTSVAINIIRDPISVLRTMVTLPNFADEFSIDDDEGKGTGLFLSDEPKAIFSKNPIHYGGILDKNGNKIARISPELNAILGWLEDREQVFHDGILYDYFKDNIKELYIKQTSDFAGGRGFDAMSELASILGFDEPDEKDRWLFEKHVGEMKNLLPITLYANEKDELFSNEIKTNRNDKNFNKNSAKIVLCTRFNENNRLKPERDISELFSLPDPLLRVFVDKPSDAVKLLRSPDLLKKAQLYIEKLSHEVLQKASELEANRKLFNENDILEYFQGHEKERKLAATLIKEHLKYQKQKAPDIINCFKYYKEFEKMCFELDGTKL